MDVCVSTYIAFAQEYFDDDTVLPEGFVYNKKRRMLCHKYKVRRLSQEALENEKSEYIEKLLLWCKNLPKSSEDNTPPRAVQEEKM